MLQFTLIKTARGLPASLPAASCPRAHLEESAPRHEAATFTPCTNCKQPPHPLPPLAALLRLVSIYLLTNRCHQGLTGTRLRGAYGFFAQDPRKNKLYNIFHMARGVEPRITTISAERKQPVWRQCLLRERDRQPYGHRHRTRHTTFSYKSLGDWPISLPPVLLAAREHNAAAAAAAAPASAMLSQNDGTDEESQSVGVTPPHSYTWIQ